MKTSELIECLQRRLAKHGDREVVVTWEGTGHGISPACIYRDHKGYLIIDGEGGCGKSYDALDPNEGEEGQ